LGGPRPGKPSEERERASFPLVANRSDRGILLFTMPESDFSAVALREGPEGTELPVRVTPRARRSAVAGLWQSSLRIQVSAPPEEGKANQELCSFLAGLFGLPKSRVLLLRGERSKDKVILLRGVSEEKTRFLLSALGGAEREKG